MSKIFPLIESDAEWEVIQPSDFITISNSAPATWFDSKDITVKYNHAAKMAIVYVHFEDYNPDSGDVDGIDISDGWPASFEIGSIKQTKFRLCLQGITKWHVDNIRQDSTAELILQIVSNFGGSFSCFISVDPIVPKVDINETTMKLVYDHTIYPIKEFSTYFMVPCERITT